MLITLITQLHVNVTNIHIYHILFQIAFNNITRYFCRKTSELTFPLLAAETLFHLLWSTDHAEKNNFWALLLLA